MWINFSAWKYNLIKSFNDEHSKTVIQRLKSNGYINQWINIHKDCLKLFSRQIHSCRLKIITEDLNWQSKKYGQGELQILSWYWAHFDSIFWLFSQLKLSRFQSHFIWPILKSGFSTVISKYSSAPLMQCWK